VIILISEIQEREVNNYGMGINHLETLQGIGTLLGV
jgi:hypothetical protein